MKSSQFDASHCTFCCASRAIMTAYKEIYEQILLLPAALRKPAGI